MKYVVAGSFEEYRKHILKMDYNASEYRYVTSPDSMRGLTKIEGFYIGTYEQRSDIEQIKQNIAYIKSVYP